MQEEIRVFKKVIRRCMARCFLIVFGRKGRRQSVYQGEKTPAARSLLKQDLRLKTKHQMAYRHHKVSDPYR
ncbi:hypothetical protein HMPREF1705_04754 [Acetomicrobium hydrogeniformans ATCC BAA-1850]|uniref:Uncharacterized protein n=1 Tax=Acetomicrobium hydrogeniformans ATCC BAA-1850 TaxID=592015 RepID=A0A0T5XBF3_9BACT|nr:hypothetical protein HMPREF1705_04754 [Acetomicrobium hydrogeniformans ATCC BAA-1850]